MPTKVITSPMASSPNAFVLANYGPLLSLSLSPPVKIKTRPHHSLHFRAAPEISLDWDRFVDHDRAPSLGQEPDAARGIQQQLLGRLAWLRHGGLLQLRSRQELEIRYVMTSFSKLVTCTYCTGTWVSDRYMTNGTETSV